MASCLFLHIFCILILTCAVHFSSGLKCLQGGESGDLSAHQPVVEAPVKEEECPNATNICSVMTEATGDGGTKQIIFQCVDKPTDMKCEGLVDSEEGKTGKVGPAYCEAELCNTIEFLKENCKGSGGSSDSPSAFSSPPELERGNGTGTGNGSSNGNSSITPTLLPPVTAASTNSTAYNIQAPSYSVLFRAFSLILPTAGAIQSKIWF